MGRLDSSVKSLFNVADRRDGMGAERPDSGQAHRRLREASSRAHKCRRSTRIKGSSRARSRRGQTGRSPSPSLLRGRYTVRAELSGFKPLEQRGLVLDPGQVLDLAELKLTVGALSETLDVSAETPVIELGTSQKSYTISDTQIRELSLNGRDFTSLLKTLPGVATNDTGFRLAFNSTEGFMVNGLRQSMNNVMLDGTPNTDTGANDGQYTQLSLDAVGEFKLQSSAFNAEFGRNAGVLITSTTRSGGKQFRGTVYGFRRDGKWDASPHDSLTGAKVPLDYKQFGGNIGGWLPVPGLSSASNKKLFFFFNHESTRAEQPLQRVPRRVPPGSVDRRLPAAAAFQRERDARHHRGNEPQRRHRVQARHDHSQRGRRDHRRYSLREQHRARSPSGTGTRRAS